MLVPMGRQASQRESPYLADELDRAILRSLQIAARRPFSAMAADLGVSDQTVARRYQQLRRRAGVRVIALAEPNVNTQDLWVVRVRVGANASAVAQSLVHRQDTAWIHYVGGASGVEIVAMVYRERGEAPKFGLLEQLSSLPSVVSAAGQHCLHMFFGGPESLLTKSGSTLCGATPSAGPQNDVRGAAELTAADRGLLAVLAVDGRASVKQLSRASGLAPETVARRVEILESTGMLYFDVEFDPELLELRCSVSMWLSVTPGQIEAAGAALAEHPQISFAAATTGTANLYAVAHCVDAESLYRYLSGPLAALPGLQAVETAPHIRILKNAGLGPAT